MKPVYFFAIVFLGICAKILVAYNFYNFSTMNPDEESNYQIAQNFLTGKGYTQLSDGKYLITPFHPKGTYKATAFHGTGTVFLYQFLLQQGVNVPTWLTIWFIISHVFFIISIAYFYYLCQLLLSYTLAQWATIFYIFYPSVFYFIGATFAYENIVVYGLIIVMYYLIKWLNGAPILPRQITAISLLITLSCLLRGHMLPIYMLILSLYLILNLRHRANWGYLAVFYSAVIVLIGLTHYPILQKNKRIFGQPILSTQIGFELLQGHNPLARGSWDSRWTMPNSDFFAYSLQQIPNLATLNEYEEGKARQEVALKWIKNNPWGELKLMVRKIAIYFLPQNFEELPYNRLYCPINAIMHILYITSIVYFLLFAYRLITPQLLLVNSPIVASIILSVVFFIGYRWRFYAEPFMLIVGLMGVESMLRQYRKKKISNE